MKNIYIGRASKTGKSLAICMVIDSDIAIGNAIIYANLYNQFIMDFVP